MSELDQEEGFLGRWSRRKAESIEGIPKDLEALPSEMTEEVVDPDVPPPPPPSDEDMPPLETLDEESDYTGFLSPNVSEALRKQALRKLFSSAIFNNVDGLDDYDEDFTSFEPLGDLITADMKHQMEVEAKRKMDAMLEDDEIQEDVVDEQDSEIDSDSETEEDEVDALSQADDPEQPPVGEALQETQNSEEKQ